MKDREEGRSRCLQQQKYKGTTAHCGAVLWNYSELGYHETKLKIFNMDIIAKKSNKNKYT